MKKMTLILLLIATLKVVNLQAQWQQIPNPFVGKVENLWMTNIQTVFASDENGNFAVSRDTGNTWTLITVPQNEDIKDLQFFGDRAGYALLSNGILRTNDRGQSWSRLVGAGLDDLEAMYFRHATMGFAVSKTGKIFSTVDGGVMWQSHPTMTTERLKDVWFLDDTTGFVVGENAQYFKTLDGGITWATANFSITGDLKDIFFTDPQIGYITGDQGQCFKTINGGQNWTKLVLPTNADLNAAYFLHPDTGYVVGENGTMYHTQDGGMSWTPNTTSTQQEINNIFMFRSDIGFAVGDSGIVLRMNQIKPKTNTAISRNATSQLIMIYPNPVQDLIYFHFNQPSNLVHHIRFFDMNQRQQIEVFYTPNSSGRNELVISLAGMSRGVYYYLIENGKNTQSGKVNIM